MFQPQEIRSEHKDVIHDVQYDYYGQRIATCSSDQTVKVSYKHTIQQTIANANVLVQIETRLNFVLFTYSMFVYRFAFRN